MADIPALPQSHGNKRKPDSVQPKPVPVPGERHQITVSAFEGPLPHPEHFAQYNEVLPGAGDRILKMAEDQMKHRHRVERRDQMIEGALSFGGMVLAFLIILAFLGVSCYLLLKGCQLTGILMGGGGFAALIGLFLLKKRKT